MKEVAMGCVCAEASEQGSICGKHTHLASVKHKSRASELRVLKAEC